MYPLYTAFVIAYDLSYMNCDGHVVVQASVPAFYGLLCESSLTLSDLPNFDRSYPLINHWQINLVAKKLCGFSNLQLKSSQP